MNTPDESPRSSPDWWDRWPGRLEWELECLERRNLNYSIIEDPRDGADRLVIEVEAPLDDGPHRVTVVYPDAFPYRQFQVYAPELPLRRHRSPVGVLCLYPDGQWSNQCCAADAIAYDVPHLVRVTEAGGSLLEVAEVPQGEPLSVYYGSRVEGGIVIDDGATSLNLDDGDSGDLTVGLKQPGARWLVAPTEETLSGFGYLLALRNAAGQALLPETSEIIRGMYQHEIHGRWVFLADPPYSTDPIALWQAALAASNATRSWARRPRDIDLLGVCFPDEVRQGEFALGWTFLARHRPRPANGRQSGKLQDRLLGPTFVRALRYTDDVLASRIPTLQPMRAKTVSLIGLGSIGAPVAIELAKARTRTLRLTDRDRLEPGNLVRHPLGLAHSGLHKAIALGVALRDHNPEVDVALNMINIGDARTEARTATEHQALDAVIAGADLMIGATAEHGVNEQLDETARFHGVPRLYLWSQSGYGGVIALLQSGKTGCYFCLRAFESDMATAGTPLVEAPEAPDSLVQPAGCAEPTFTAIHPDLLPISNEATRMALGFLCGPGGGYPPYDADVLTVQTRNLDGTPIPPRWQTFKLPPNPACPTCAA